MSHDNITTIDTGTRVADPAAQVEQLLAGDTTGNNLQNQYINAVFTDLRDPAERQNIGLVMQGTEDQATNETKYTNDEAYTDEALASVNNINTNNLSTDMSNVVQKDDHLEMDIAKLYGLEGQLTERGLLASYNEVQRAINIAQGVDQEMQTKIRIEQQLQASGQRNIYSNV